MSKMENEPISEVVQTRCFETFLIDGPICKTVVKQFAVITKKDAEENSEAVVNVSNGILYPMLVDTRLIKSIDKEARDHFAMRKRKGKVKAIGILVANPISVIVGNFFMGLNKPSVPTKLFTNEKSAIKWLKSLK